METLMAISNILFFTIGFMLGAIVLYFGPIAVEYLDRKAVRRNIDD